MFHFKTLLFISGCIVHLLLVGCSTNAQTTAAHSAIGADDSAAVGSLTGGSERGRVRTLQESSDAHATNGPSPSSLTIYFALDRTHINSGDRQQLVAAAKEWSRYPRSIRLEGHGDERGTREYNLALGEMRGKAVRDFLMMQGVDGTQIEVVSYGEEKPADRGVGEYAWRRNRRVELM